MPPTITNRRNEYKRLPQRLLLPLATWLRAWLQLAAGEVADDLAVMNDGGAVVAATQVDTGGSEEALI